MSLLDLFTQIEWEGWWQRPFSERWIDETVCSMLVGVACGVIGCYVVLRRMALIGVMLSSSSSTVGRAIRPKE